MEPTDDTGRYRRANAERIAYRKHLVAHLKFVAVAPLHWLQCVVRLYLHDCQVGLS